MSVFNNQGIKAGMSKARTATSWKQGEVVRGILVNKKAVPNSNSTIYTLELYDANTCEPLNKTEDFFGSTNLDSQWGNLELGTGILTKCLGSKPNPKTKRSFVEFETIYFLEE